MNWNGTINVTSEEDDHGSIHSVRLEEFLFFELENRQILGHTTDRVYRLPWGSLKVLANLISASSDQFEKVDKACLANVHKIKRLDTKLGIAHFAVNGGREKKCFVAESHMKRIQSLLEKLQRSETGSSEEMLG